MRVMRFRTTPTRRRRCRPWLAAALALRVAAAGADEFAVDVWDAEKGLPNSSVTAIAQTPDGYLWVGTYNGLARFDGVGFATFDPANTPALQHARVRRLYVAPGGDLWIATHDGSLTRRHAGEFTLEWKGDGSPDTAATLVSARSNQVTFALFSGQLIRRAEPAVGATNAWQLFTPPGAGAGALAAEDATGVVWYRGRDSRLWRLREGSFEQVSVVSNGLRGQQINALVADRRGRIWLGTDQEIAAWNGRRFEDMTPTNGEPELNVTFLYPADDGSVWSVANDRVRRSVGRGWTIEAAALAGALGGVNSRLGALEDRQGGVWFYHYGRGLFHVQAGGQVRPMTTENGFPCERVDCFSSDREGNFWAGLDRNGLVRLKAMRFQVVSILDGNTPRAAVSVCEDARGAVWIGALGGGLNSWRDGTLRNVPLPGDTPKGFVFSVCPDQQDQLWLSAGEEDLSLCVADEVRSAPAAVHGVKAIFTDREGRVWIGAKSGLSCWEKDRLRTFGAAEGLERAYIRVLAQDRRGCIWAGTDEGSLLQLSNGVFQAFQPADTPQPHAIWSLLPDEAGGIWAGTFRGGLLHFQDGRFVRCTAIHGLPNDVIGQLLDDGAGHLWAGSQQGIFRVDLAALRDFVRGKTASVACVSYGHYDGLPALECAGGYQPACWRGRDGRLWFATVKGVVSVQPAELKLNRQPPPVVIEQVRVDGQLAEPQPTAKGGFLDVPPGRRQIEFHYAGLSYSAPDKVQYRYQLAGLDPGWVEAGSQRMIQFNYLKPGTYQFRVTACNNDGFWNPTGAAVRFRVEPHFYETWWFAALLGISGLALVAGTVRRLATRRLRRELARLERQRAVELDRARIAKDIHDDLGAGLTQITLLSELARRDRPPDAEGHLTQISDTARELTRAMDEIVWAVNPHNDTLDGLASYVCKFAQDYLRVAGIRCRLDAPAHLPPQPLAAEVRHNLFLAVKETLNNIVKHAHATEVWLRLRLDGLTLRAIIEDNGRGLLAPDVAHDSQAGRISGGHGLDNLRRRLAAIGGTCAIASQPGQGTRVEFALQLDRQPSPVLATGTPPGPASS